MNENPDPSVQALRDRAEAAEQQVEVLERDNAECHNIVAWLWSITDSDDAELLRRVHAVLGMDDANGECGNAICGDLLELRQQVIQAEADRDHAREERDKLMAALNGVIDATQLPSACPHDSEPDICDCCRFAQEKAIGTAINAARAVIVKAAGR